MASQGFLVAVVGPSGAGKDTVIDYARDVLSDNPDYAFVTRVITRPADAGGENHDAVSEAEFSRLAADGAFAVSWEAHGLHYGIPRDSLDACANGLILIANGSRSAMNRFDAAFGEALRTVVVTAPKDVLAGRLASRGREAEDDILGRLDRSDTDAGEMRADLTIVNDRSPAEAGESFVNFLKGLHAQIRAQAEATGGRQSAG